MAVARDGQPEAVTPQQAQQKVPVVRRQPPSRQLRPGDLICGDCGEGNGETRKFCSRCGCSLAEAETVRTPWWRKLLPRRGAKVRSLGDRPKRSGRAGKSKFGEAVGTTFLVLRRIVTITLLIAGIVYSVYGPFRGWVNQQAMSLKHQAEVLIFPQYVPVSPTAGVECLVDIPPDHGCGAGVDGFSNTYWASPVDGRPPVVVLKFDRSVHLARAIIRNGANDDFQGSHRARKLHLVFSTGKTADIDMIDNPDPNQYDIPNGEGATSVEIHVVDLFRSVKGTSLAITEIELFERR